MGKANQESEAGKLPDAQSIADAEQFPIASRFKKGE